MGCNLTSVRINATYIATNPRSTQRGVHMPFVSFHINISNSTKAFS